MLAALEECPSNALVMGKSGSGWNFLNKTTAEEVVSANLYFVAKNHSLS